LAAGVAGVAGSAGVAGVAAVSVAGAAAVEEVAGVAGVAGVVPPGVDVGGAASAVADPSANARAAVVSANVFIALFSFRLTNKQWSGEHFNMPAVPRGSICSR
jgi:hypothetical protein